MPAKVRGRSILECRAQRAVGLFRYAYGADWRGRLFFSPKPIWSILAILMIGAIGV